MRGKCFLFDVSDLQTEAQIEAQHVLTIINKYKLQIPAQSIILFKTRNSAFAEQGPFAYNYIGLAHDAAQLLVQLQVKLVGTDFIGIERSDVQVKHETHDTLLQHGIVIVEGLRLQHVPGCYSLHNDTSNIIAPTQYYLFCLPLKMHGIDSAPARAVLFRLQ